MTPLAIVDAAGRVVTFVRADVPEGWLPPDGCMATPADQLPAGWQYAADDSPVPETVSARQARLWLIRHGITLATVDATISAIPDAATRDEVRVDWEYATEIRRASPFVAQLGAALGLDVATLDRAFREAAVM